MEASQQDLRLTHIDSHEEHLEKEEVYYMRREIVPAAKAKKANHKKKGYRTSSEGVEINETLKMAARGYGTNHRLDM